MWDRSVERYYRVHPEDICYLTFTLEAYEGLAVVTTVDKDACIVRIHIAPGWEDDFDAIIKAETQLRIQPVMAEYFEFEEYKTS
ncbi:MAG: DUF4911 domain-containing protein [Thermodesulforhabdaceae bacterium]